MTTNPMRIIALVVTLAVVAVTASLLIELHGDALELIRRLRFTGQAPYAAGIAWIVVAPLFFVVGSSYVEVATGPWVLLVVIQLGVLATVTLHLRDAMTTAYFLTAAVCGAAALVSLAVAAAGRGARPGDF